MATQVTRGHPGHPSDPPLHQRRADRGDETGVILINTPHGSLVDTAALVRALHSGQVAAVGLDVVEPASDAEIGAALPNTIVTPHIAYNTHRRSAGSPTSRWPTSAAGSATTANQAGHGMGDLIADAFGQGYIAAMLRALAVPVGRPLARNVARRTWETSAPSGSKGSWTGLGRLRRGRFGRYAYTLRWISWRMASAVVPAASRPLSHRRGLRRSGRF